ncbi:MAG: hypothetical protein ACREFO_01945, partial [Acetobacteraceae bacterium]
MPMLTLGADRETSMVGTPAFVFSGLLIPLRLFPRATNVGGRTLAFIFSGLLIPLRLFPRATNVGGRTL